MGARALLTLNCEACGESFVATRRDARYCSKPCRKKAWDAANVERKREHDAQFRERHRAELNAARREARASDPEPFRARERRRDRRAWQREYQQLPSSREAKRASDARYKRENRERVRAVVQRWVDEHPDEIRAIRQRRYAMKRGAPGYATAAQLVARVAYWGDRCWMCRGPFDTLDHVKPLSKGGSNWPANLRPACRSCNSRKRATWPWLTATPRRR